MSTSWKPFLKANCIPWIYRHLCIGQPLLICSSPHLDKGLCAEESGLDSSCPTWSEKVCWLKRTPSRHNLSWEIYLHRGGVVPAASVPTGGEFGGLESTGWKPAEPLKNSEWCSFISSCPIPGHGPPEMLSWMMRQESWQRRCCPATS